jgi:hypothetical protein
MILENFLTLQSLVSFDPPIAYNPSNCGVTLDDLESARSALQQPVILARRGHKGGPFDIKTVAHAVLYLVVIQNRVLL